MGIYDRPYYRDETSVDLSPSWEHGSGVALIIFACVGVFVADAVFSGRSHAIDFFLSLNNSDLYRPLFWWRTFTYGFVHSYQNIWHLLFNMFGIWVFGRSVEQQYGKSEFLRIYFISIVACGVAWLILHNFVVQTPGPVVGASGAISCITMLFILNHPKAVLMLWGVVPVQAWLLGAFLIVTNLLGTQPTLGSVGGEQEKRIAWDVHLAGMAFGAAYFYSGIRFNFLGNPVAWFQRTKRRLFGPRLRAYSPDNGPEKAVSDDEEADRILDKIHQFGQDSLTTKEKRFLTNYSKTVRERREKSTP